MLRRWLAAATAAALTIFSVPAFDRSRPPEADPSAGRDALREIFSDGTVTEDGNGLTARGFGSEVIVARIDADGAVVRVCVDSEAAARRFLETPPAAPAASAPGER